MCKPCMTLLTSTLLNQGAKLYGADAWLQQPPNMTLRVAGMELVDAHMEAFGQDQPTRPVVFNASIPLWALEPSMLSMLALHFDDIPNHRVPLTAVAQEAQEIQPRTWPPAVYTFSQTHATHPRLGGRLIKMHCEWCEG